LLFFSDVLDMGNAPDQGIFHVTFRAIGQVEPTIQEYLTSWLVMIAMHYAIHAGVVRYISWIDKTEGLSGFHNSLGFVGGSGFPVSTVGLRRGRQYTTMLAAEHSENLCPDSE
jgi:hypothetical protein